MACQYFVCLVAWMTLTEEDTGPSCAEVPLAVKLTPLGALSLTSRAARDGSVVVRQGQLTCQTCGSVIEVFVNELKVVKSAFALITAVYR